MTSYEVVRGSDAGGEAHQASRALARMLQGVERLLMRYGLALILLWIGAMKFTAYEASGIRGLEANSPFMRPLLAALGTQGLSNVIGVV